MYKKKIKLWRLSKYYKAHEKAELAQAISCYQSQGQQIHSAALNSRRIPLHLLRRFCQQHSQFKHLVDHLPPATPSDKLDEQYSWHLAGNGTIRNTWSNPSRSLPWSPELEMTELVMKCADAYYTSMFSGRNLSQQGSEIADIQLHDPNIPRDLSSWVLGHRRFAGFGGGLCMMQLGHFTIARKLLSNAGGNVEELLQRNPHQFLFDFMCTFSDRGWNDYSELRGHILKLMTSVSSDPNVLGMLHPISRILKAFEVPDIFRSSVPRLVSLIWTIFQQHAQLYSGWGVWEQLLENAILDFCRILGNFADTERPREEFLQLACYIRKQRWFPALLNIRILVGLRFLDNQQALKELAQGFVANVLERWKVPQIEDLEKSQYSSFLGLYTRLFRVQQHENTSYEDLIGANILKMYGICMIDTASSGFGFQDPLGVSSILALQDLLLYLGKISKAEEITAEVPESDDRRPPLVPRRTCRTDEDYELETASEVDDQSGNQISSQTYDAWENEIPPPAQLDEQFQATNPNPSLFCFETDMTYLDESCHGL